MNDAKPWTNEEKREYAIEPEAGVTGIRLVINETRVASRMRLYEFTPIFAPKTKKSVRSLPLIQPVRGLLKLHRAKAGDGEWVFNRNLMTVARSTIRPTLEKNQLEWKGFHAGRRGLGTVLRQITGNSTAGRDVLGHEDEALTKDHYEGALPELALKSMRLLEEKVTKQ